MPRPSPARAAQSPTATPAADDEWTIGVSDIPPWELSGWTERPPALPAAQPAPWQAAQLERAPWEPPARHEPAPWDALVPDADSDDRAAADQPDEAPWDRPAPFTLDDDGDTNDPYDAFAPLADDFTSPAAPATAGAAVAVARTPRAAAPRASAPTTAKSRRRATPAAAEPPMLDTAPVFGDAAATPTELPTRAALAVEDAPAHTEPDDEWVVPALDDLPAAEWPASGSMPDLADEPSAPAEADDIVADRSSSAAFEAADVAEMVPVVEGSASDAEAPASDGPVEQAPAAEAAAPEPPANPLEWPPVPTDFPPKKQPSRARRQAAPANPLEWPPIPADLFRAPGSGAEGTRPAPATPVAGLWDAPAAAQPATASSSPAAPSMERITPAAAAMDAPAQPAASAASASTSAASATAPVEHTAEPFNLAPPPAEPAVEDDAWALRAPVEPAAASVAPPVTADQPGDVFARFVGAVSAAPASAETPRSFVAEPARAAAPSKEGGDDLWFLANEPQPVDGDESAAEAEPSSMQTAVATVLVAAIVIGLVIVFLLLFTSVFR